MEQTLRVPKFKSEGDEARWWVENKERLTKEFERGATEGKLGRGTVARRGNTPTTTIRLDPEDIAKARFHAEQRGLKYQTYLKMLIRQALRQEEANTVQEIQQDKKSMPKPPKHPGLDGRSRNEDGEIRRKRSDHPPRSSQIKSLKTPKSS